MTRRLSIELFVALSLAVCYGLIVQQFAIGTQTNTTNIWCASACSVQGNHLANLGGGVWQGRLGGLLINGWLVDHSAKAGVMNAMRYSDYFALYHGGWLFLLFAAVIISIKHALFINLGIFSGMMYSFTPASGLYFYPWDIPATLFFTLAVIFFMRGQMGMMVIAICAGSMFKETVLCCAPLGLFFAAGIPRRATLFAIPVGFYIVAKRFALDGLHVNIPVFSMDNAKHVGDLLGWHQIKSNLHLLISPTVNHVAFASAGMLIAVLLVCWHKSWMPYIIVMALYVVGQLAYGAFNEFRIFWQILPLSLMLLAAWNCGQKTVELRKGIALAPFTLALIVLSTLAAGWQYHRLL